MAIDEIIKKQRKFFSSGKTLPTDFRAEMLKKLRAAIKTNESEIADALKEDLGKGAYESYMCEIGLCLSEITYMLKHIKKFTKAKRNHTPLAHFPSSSYQKASPYGNVLIMSPWNYPFLLTVEPLVDAIAAGNTAVVKPSAYSPRTAGVLENVIKECFDEEYVAVVRGGREENIELLEKKFDMVFFTGSTTVGKEVLMKCARHLTPAVLELGGKSPCIVDETSDIKLAARKIVFGKYLNCGQTCVAPDYVLCQSTVKNDLIKALKAEIKKQYGDNPLADETYGKIVNSKHFERILSLTDTKKIVIGGGYDRESLKIEPTVMENVDFDDAIMSEEIFGPVLPIVEYDAKDDVFEILKDKPKPLALYIFSSDKKFTKTVLNKVRFGGGCVNDVVIHLATSEMGFGGVGESGMGSYHGKAGFDAFSHNKSIVKGKNYLDLPMRYKPYKSKFYTGLLRIFLR